MKPADLAEWAVMSKLLDEAIDLPNAERGAWLERLTPEHAHLKPHLAELLAASALSDTSIPAMPHYTGDSTMTGGGFKAGQRIGTYTLIRPIGKGGMGSVWLAEASESAVKLPVAIKLPHVSTLTNAGYLRERFARERVILAALNHPNIARLHEAGVTIEGQPFLALEYIDGETILTHCNNARMSISGRLALFVQVQKALQYAHANLIIHRDLKPSNIIITRTGEVKLLDFGIAKLLDTESQAAEETALTQMGGRAMTPDYASPEQIRGESLTTASDVYSSGVLLYELLTGKRPYKLKRGSRAELEEAILTSDISRPSTMVGDDFATETNNSPNRLKRTLAGDLDTIVIKALKKNADARYPSAQALQNDIERYLNGQPVLAQADSVMYRMKKFFARNRLVTAATASVFFALTAGLGVAIWQAGAAKEQAKIAKQEAARAEAVKKFLVSLLDRNSRFEKDPAAARAMSVQDLLEKEAVPRLQSSFDDQPAIKVELLASVAKLLLDLGKHKESLALWRKADELALRTADIDNTTRIEVMLGRTHLARGTGAISEADSTSGRLVAAAEKLGDAQGALRVSSYIAAIGRSTPEHEKQEKRALDELEQLEARDPTNKQLFENYYRIARYYGQLPDWPKTIHFSRRAIAASEKTGHPDFTGYAFAQETLAKALGSVGEVRESLVWYERALHALENSTGKTSRWRETHAYLGGALSAVGRTEDAKRAFQKVAASYPPSHKPQLGDLNATSLEAEFALEMGKPALALQTLERFPPLLETISKLEPTIAISAYLVSAFASDLTGDVAGAEATHRSIVTLADGKLSDWTRAYFTYKFVSARRAMLADDYDGALKLLSFQDDAVGDKIEAPTSFDYGFTYLNAQAAMAHASRYDHVSANRNMERAFSSLALVKNKDDYPVLASDLAVAHGHVKLRAGDPLVAIAELRKGLSEQEKTQASTSPFLMETRLNLAEALARSGNKAEAKSLCARVKANIKTYAKLHPWFTKRLKAVETLL